MAYSNNRSTFFCPAGTKWYWEFVPTTTYNYAACGITTISHEWDINPGGGNSTPSGHGVGFYGVEVDVDGSRTSPAGNSAWASGDIIGFAYDVDANTIKKYINGSLDFTYSSVPVSTDGDYSPSFGDFGGSATATINVNFGQDSSFAGLKTAQGNQDSNGIGDFYYEPPADHLALCTDNLSDPEIALPTDHFNTILYDGTGAELAITGAGFQPDFSWIKARESAYNHRVFDVVRGVTKELYTNTTGGDVTDAQSLKSFDSDGFTLGTSSGVNKSGADNAFVSWNWKGGGTPTATNSAGAGNVPTAGSVKINGANSGAALAGTIPATKISANTTSGFSTVTFEGTGSAGTVAHGLSQAPELIIVKNIDMSNEWPVGTTAGGMNFTHYLKLNGSRAVADDDRQFNDTNPTASVFSLGHYDGTNENNDTILSYCFTSIEGYSKVGGYTAAGSDGNMNFLYCGFRPAFVLFKETSATNGWAIIDNKRNTYNLADLILIPSSAGAVYDYSSGVDFVSNGIKLRNNNGMWGDANADYIFYAIAESPFKTSNAR